MYTYSQGLQWCTQIADGLAFLHSQRPLIIHRDIKAANVLLTEGVICDALQSGEAESRTGRVSECRAALCPVSCVFAAGRL